jgi:hypothetical protein
MNILKSLHVSDSKITYINLMGFGLICLGLGVLLEYYSRTGWFVFLSLVITGIIFLFIGIQKSRLSFVNTGCIACGASLSVFALLNPLLNMFYFRYRIGSSITVFGLGWIAITVLSLITRRSIVWWPLIPGSVLSSTGTCILISSLRMIDFIGYIFVSLGLVFIIWGIYRRLFGLVIPGCILFSSGLGVYLGWGIYGEPNALSRTGLMLVVFSLGWGLMVVFPRLFSSKFVWWPLIPGGTLAMVGCGLYIGGNPGNALGFLSNTGSIGLMIFGFYLLLMKRGIHQ